MYTAKRFHPSAEAYQAIADVFNADWPEDPVAASTWQHEDTARVPQYLFQRFVVEAENQVVATGWYGEDAWSPVPGKYMFTYAMHPDHQGEAIQQAIYEFVMEALAPRTPVPTQLWSDSREDRPLRNDFLLAKGFEVMMREPRSILDLSKFDPHRFASVEDSARREGLELMSLAAYQALDPDWARKFWALRLEIDRDIPWPDPIKPIPFEDFIKRFDHPHFLADAQFVAVDQHNSTEPGAWQMVGTSQIGVDPNHKEKVHTWVTGVRRAYRRKGLATALKVRTIAFAAAHGARLVETDNDENNPMYDLNLSLGFEPHPALLALRLTLPDAGFARRS